MFAIVIWSDNRRLIDSFEFNCLSLFERLFESPFFPCEFDWRCVNLDEHNILEGIL